MESTPKRLEELWINSRIPEPHTNSLAEPICCFYEFDIQDRFTGIISKLFAPNINANTVHCCVNINLANSFEIHILLNFRIDSRSWFVPLSLDTTISYNAMSHSVPHTAKGDLIWHSAGVCKDDIWNWFSNYSGAFSITIQRCYFTIAVLVTDFLGCSATMYAEPQ